MPQDSRGGFAFGSVAAIVVTGFLLTTIGDLPSAWMPCLCAVVVVVAISRALPR